MSQIALNKEDRRAAIIDMEKTILSLPQLSIEAKHYFAGGMYARELFMPKNSAFTGAIHTKEHFVNLIGDISVATDEGVVRYTGYCTFTGVAGSKRAVFLHEDTVWTTFHVTDKITVSECEEDLTVSTYEDFLQIVGGSKCLLV